MKQIPPLPTPTDASLSTTPHRETSKLETAALLAELKATFERLLARFDSEAAQVQAEHVLPKEEADWKPGADGFWAPALQKLLRLRANRRRGALNEFFDWPTWDMLLDLAAVHAEGGHVSVSSICISSGAPQSTALRKLAALENAKLIRRYFHGSDKRRVCIAITDEAAEMVMAAIRDEVALYQQIVAPQ
ncbi:hypothetical protein [Roseomonas chloroacetimidivorans]|uniref:hypothetical protein n=1 Tax=Roseomonas chloroacetimidivorans TaxID=1766656 RepID=UPI003C713522